MRTMIIKNITIHCSATQNKQHINTDMIRKWHTDRGFSDIGYHAVILTDGTIERGRPLNIQGAHVYGYNKDNFGICMIGGVNEDGDSEMNFTVAQFESLDKLLIALTTNYPVTVNDIKGHRDWSPDVNLDGVVQHSEWLKDCPCFDVKHWLATGEAVFEVV